MTAERKDWQESGEGRMSRKQQNLLNAACQDLADQLRWHGYRFDKDSYRHFLAAVVLGEIMVPGINTGYGNPGLIRMARSSKELTKSQATEAIGLAFDIGDRPEDQGIQSRPVRWCEVIVRARWIVDEVAA